MSENKKKRGMKVGGVYFVKVYLSFEIISRVIKGMNLIDPEGFLIEGVDP
jgi:hypothetical protein